MCRCVNDVYLEMGLGDVYLFLLSSGTFGKGL